jgi:hypothetical protein
MRKAIFAAMEKEAEEIKEYSTIHNQKRLMPGRLLFMVFQKEVRV